MARPQYAAPLLTPRTVAVLAVLDTYRKGHANSAADAVADAWPALILGLLSVRTPGRTPTLRTPRHAPWPFAPRHALALLAPPCPGPARPAMPWPHSLSRWDVPFSQSAPQPREEPLRELLDVVTRAVGVDAAQAVLDTVGPCSRLTAPHPHDRS